MSNEFDSKQEELKKLQSELNSTGMSRRKFLDRLAVIGIGFGAAAALGKSAEAREMPEPSVSVGSTNPAIDGIVGDEHAEGEGSDALTRVAYRRFYYRRFFRRFYRRYGRFYRRYSRFYRRYGRFFRRFYRRF